MKMNDFNGKELLAAVRGKDYAHAGEEDAIVLVFENIPPQPGRKILDAGCGRGGTADFVQKKGYGQVLGIDIEAESIDYARETYPDVEFHVCDVVEAGSKFPETFGLIYLFNSFYAFEDKNAALLSLRKTAKTGARLALFDYVCYKPEVLEPDVMLSQKPCTQEEYADLLSAANWELSKSQNLDQNYIKWYRDFLARLDELGHTDTYPAEMIEQVRKKYIQLLFSLERRIMGGVLLVAYAQ
jgi:SAM-dependent methyltransferase